MEERHRKLVENSKKTGKHIDWDEPIYADSIYPENPAKSLMMIYKWLVEKEETHMPACSLYSKQVNLKRIKKLKDLFVGFKERKTVKHQSKKGNKKFKEGRI